MFIVKIGVCGLGLGYCLSHYLASLGHDIIGVDVNSKTFTDPNPKFDDEMKQFAEQNFDRYSTRIIFTNNHAILGDRDYIIIFVATPLINRRLSMKFVLSALETCVRNNPKATYLIFSTMPVGGMETIHNAFPKIRTFYTPPMVRAGHFLSTFKSPPGRIQPIGFKDAFPSDVIDLYRQWLEPNILIIPSSERSVEVAKLATNMMLSIKIVSANAIASWLKDEKLAKQVCNIVNSDPRVGIGYFTPGGPAAGPCFPRDVTELVEASKGTDLEKLLKVINELNKTNELV